MEDSEFRKLVIEAMQAPTTKEEEIGYGAQNSTELGIIYHDRVWKIIRQFWDEASLARSEQIESICSVIAQKYDRREDNIEDYAIAEAVYDAGFRRQIVFTQKSGPQLPKDLDVVQEIVRQTHTDSTAMITSADLEVAELITWEQLDYHRRNDRDGSGEILFISERLVHHKWPRSSNLEWIPDAENMAKRLVAVYPKVAESGHSWLRVTCGRSSVEGLELFKPPAKLEGIINA